MKISSPDKLIGCAWRLLCRLTHHDRECVHRPESVCVWGPFTLCECTVIERGWSLGSSACERELVSRGLEGGSGDKVPQPGALSLGWGGCAGCTNDWNDGVKERCPGTPPTADVCPLRLHSEPRVPGLHWSPPCPGTRQRIKAAQPTSVVVRCAYFLWADSSVTFTPASPLLPANLGTMRAWMRMCVWSACRVQSLCAICGHMTVWEVCRCLCLYIFIIIISIMTLMIQFDILSVFLDYL